MYRVVPDRGYLEVLLGHPGGPYFRRRDLGAWGVPKGLIEAHEPALDAARREFLEETGLEPRALPASEADYLALGDVTLRSGKRVSAWAFRGTCEPDTLESNEFELEWPPRSGRRQRFPEIDRFAFFELAEAADRIAPAQRPLLTRLSARVQPP